MSRNLSHLVIKNANLFTQKQFDLIAYLLVKTNDQYQYCEFICHSLECSMKSLKLTIHHLAKKINIKVINDFVVLNVQSLKDFIVNSVYNEEIPAEHIPADKDQCAQQFNDYLVNAFHGFQYDLCNMKTEGSKQLIYSLLKECILDEDYEALIQCLFSNTNLYQVCLQIDEEKTKGLIDGFKQALLFNDEDCDFYQLAQNHIKHIKQGYDLDATCYHSIEDFKKNEFYIDHRDVSIIFDNSELIEDYFIDITYMNDFFGMSYERIIDKILDCYLIDNCNSYYVDSFKDLHDHISNEYKGLLTVIGHLQDNNEPLTLNNILSNQWSYTDKIMYKAISFNIGTFSKYHQLVFTDFLTSKGLI